MVTINVKYKLLKDFTTHGAVFAEKKVDMHISLRSDLGDRAAAAAAAD